MSERIKNNRVFKFFFRSRVFTKRQKPFVEILYLDKNHQLKNPKTLELFDLRGCIVDDDEQTRKVQQLGTSWGITLPQGWLKSVSNKGYVKGRLIVEEGTHETYILVYKPKLEEVMVRA